MLKAIPGVEHNLISIISRLNKWEIDKINLKSLAFTIYVFAINIYFKHYLYDAK